MVILEKTIEIDTEPPETSDKEDEKEPESVQKPEILEKEPEILEKEPEIREIPETPKKRGRPRKNVPKPEPKPRGRPPQPPPAPAPTPAPTPAPAFDMDMYNQHLLRALMDHSRTSILRKEERWKNLVKF